MWWFSQEQPLKQISIRNENAEDSYCMEIKTMRPRMIGTAVPKNKVKIVFNAKAQASTFDNREKAKSEFINTNLSLNSNSAQTLLTKKKDTYQHTFYQGRFIGVQKYKSRSPKRLILAGEVYKSQNLNNEDCSKIIKELRKRIKKKEDLVRLQQIEVEEDIVTMIKNLGYKQSEIDHDLKTPNTAINNLYQVFHYQKLQQKIEDENNAGITMRSKPMHEYMGDHCNSYATFDEDERSEERKKTSMEEMADRFFKLRNNHEHRSRYHKIRFAKSRK